MAISDGVGGVIHHGRWKIAVILSSVVHVSCQCSGKYVGACPPTVVTPSWYCTECASYITIETLKELITEE